MCPITIVAEATIVATCSYALLDKELRRGRCIHDHGPSLLDSGLDGLGVQEILTGNNIF